MKNSINYRPNEKGIQNKPRLSKLATWALCATLTFNPGNFSQAKTTTSTNQQKTEQIMNTSTSTDISQPYSNLEFQQTSPTDDFAKSLKINIKPEHKEIFEYLVNEQTDLEKNITIKCINNSLSNYKWNADRELLIAAIIEEIDYSLLNFSGESSVIDSFIDKPEESFIYDVVQTIKETEIAEINKRKEELNQRKEELNQRKDAIDQEKQKNKEEIFWNWKRQKVRDALKNLYDQYLIDKTRVNKIWEMLNKWNLSQSEKNKLITEKNGLQKDIDKFIELTWMEYQLIKFYDVKITDSKLQKIFNEICNKK